MFPETGGFQIRFLGTLIQVGRGSGPKGTPHSPRLSLLIAWETRPPRPPTLLQTLFPPGPHANLLLHQEVLKRSLD